MSYTQHIKRIAAPQGGEMSENMVERVARAIWARRRQATEGLWPLPAWEDENEALREDVRNEARAAIEAMRQPTDAILAAGVATRDKPRGMSAIWIAMIDAALA